MTWQTITQFDVVTSVAALGVTLVAYLVALKLFKALNSSVLFHPILIGALLVTMACLLTGITLPEYQDYVAPLNWLLGPVTVALAVPLYQQLSVIYRAGAKALLVIMLGGCIAPLSALAWFVWFDFSEPVQRSILSKSITTPLAMDTAELIGGIPALAAAIVVMTGIIGVVFSHLAFKLSHCDYPQAQGLALGTISHAIGTAHAQQLSNKTAAFSTLALCINGVLTAIILPTILWLFG
jgi:putative effector of murein hydrolase